MSANLEQPSAGAAPLAGSTAVSTDSGNAAGAASNAAQVATPNAEATATTGASPSPQSERQRLDEEFQRALKGEDVQPEQQAAPTAEQDTPEPGADLIPDEFDDTPLAFDYNSLHKKYPRAEKKMLQEVAEAFTPFQQLQQTHDEIGEVGVGLAKGLLPHLLSVPETPEEIDTTAEAIAGLLDGYNPALLPKMGQRLVQQAIADERVNPETGRQMGEEFAESQLKSRWGDGVSVSLFDDVVRCINAGIIDVDRAREILAEDGPVSAREKQLEQRLAQLEGTTKATAQAKRAEAMETQKREAQLIDQTLSRGAYEKVFPAALKLNWAVADADAGKLAEAERKLETNEAVTAEEMSLVSRKEFGEYVSAWLDKKYKSLPEYAQIQKLKEQGNAYRNGSFTPAFKVLQNKIDAKVEAAFTRSKRLMQPTFARSFSSSRNAQLAKGQQSGAPQQEAPPQAAPQIKPEMTPAQQREALDQWLAAQRADARSASTVGVRQ